MEGVRHTPRGGCTNLLFGKIFARNCINMKEIVLGGGPRGVGGVGVPTLDPPMNRIVY